METIKQVAYFLLVKVIGSIPTLFSLGFAYWKLPKLETWKDPDKFYVYLETIINSKFVKLLTEKTHFYLDDLALQKIQILIKNRENFDTVYDLWNGKITIKELPDNIWELWNFVYTVLSVRSLL
jgi:hypothetical protein